MRVSAIVEMLVLLVILTLVDAFVLNGHRFWDMNPHPFWIPVLLMAAQYGAAEGLLAALFATCFYLIGNTSVLTPAEGVNHYDWIYTISVNPILWLIGGWVVGELRQRHIRERSMLTRELDESHQREDLISDSYKFVKHRKESLEVQVSGQLSSSIEAYRAAKAVETLDPKSVMQGVERLVKSVLGPQKFSLYLFNENKLSATIIHGWAPGDKYTQEIDSFSPLYQAVVGQRELLVVANEQHEISLDGQGIVAGPVMDAESSRVIGMLKIEQMDFTSLSLNTVETFRALSEWIGTALVNARNYQSVKSESIVNPERNMLSYSYFKRQSDYMSKLAKRVGFDLSMLVIKLNDAKALSDADRITIARQIGESVKAVLRSVDLAFDYQTDGEEYSILLPATAQAGAAIVRDKIAKDMDRALRGKSGVTFNYIVQALHEVR
ncbi:MAG: GAF domain-containing protein [Pseudomonadota bacterium]